MVRDLLHSGLDWMPHGPARSRTDPLSQWRRLLGFDRLHRVVLYSRPDLLHGGAGVEGRMESKSPLLNVCTLQTVYREDKSFCH